MGKKIKWPVFFGVILLLSAVIGWRVFSLASGSKPFKDLTVGEISSVTVEVLPPDKSAELGQEDIERLVNNLRAVTTYRKDDSYREYSGQAVVFTIHKTDDGTLVVMAYNPFLIIDGTGYRTKYEPCQALNVLGNELIE